jgi:hypothetical protein
MIQGPVKAAEVRAIKGSVGKPDLGKGGERLVQGSDRFQRGAPQIRSEESKSQDRHSDEPQRAARRAFIRERKQAIFAVNVHMNM